MSNANIVHIDVKSMGTHCFLEKRTLDQIVQSQSPESLQALIDIVGQDLVVGLILKFHRKQAGYKTVKSLADEASPSDAQLNRLENGLIPLTKNLLSSLCPKLPRLTDDLQKLNLLPQD